MYVLWAILDHAPSVGFVGCDGTGLSSGFVVRDLVRPNQSVLVAISRLSLLLLLNLHVLN